MRFPKCLVRGAGRKSGGRDCSVMDTIWRGGLYSRFICFKCFKFQEQNFRGCALPGVSVSMRAETFATAFAYCKGHSTEERFA